MARPGAPARMAAGAVEFRHPLSPGKWPELRRGHIVVLAEMMAPQKLEMGAEIRQANPAPVAPGPATAGAGRRGGAGRPCCLPTNTKRRLACRLAAAPGSGNSSAARRPKAAK